MIDGSMMRWGPRDEALGLDGISYDISEWLGCCSLLMVHVRAQRPVTSVVSSWAGRLLACLWPQCQASAPDGMQSASFDGAFRAQRPVTSVVASWAGRAEAPTIEGVLSSRLVGF